MKIKTALKQSQASLKFLSVAIVVTIFLAVKYPGKYTFVPLGVFVFFWAGDLYNMVSIRRRAARGRSYLDKRIP